jgi:hypothetical protein
MSFALRRGVLLAVAAVMLLYCAITALSDGALEKLVDNGPCSLDALMHPSSTTDVCDVSTAAVTSKQTHYGKGSSKYELVVRAPGATATSFIRLPADTMSGRFYERIQKGETIRLQRVAKKGYYLSGRVIAVADNESANETLNSPRMHLRYSAIQGIFGIVLLVLAGMMRRGYRTRPEE